MCNNNILSQSVPTVKTLKNDTRMDCISAQIHCMNSPKGMETESYDVLTIYPY